jgi:hypothetical protein
MCAPGPEVSLEGEEATVVGYPMRWGKVYQYSGAVELVGSRKGLEECEREGQNGISLSRVSMYEFTDQEQGWPREDEGLG